MYSFNDRQLGSTSLNIPTRGKTSQLYQPTLSEWSEEGSSFWKFSQSQEK